MYKERVIKRKMRPDGAQEKELCVSVACVRDETVYSSSSSDSMY